MGSTIQDDGRHATRMFGVPVGGAVDWYSYALSNILLNNEAGAASIEIVPGAGWSARVLSSGFICCCGPGVRFFVNHHSQNANWPCYVKDGDVIGVKHSDSGIYAYLSVSGGWDLPMVFESRSSCLSGSFGGLDGRMLQVGDMLESIPCRSEVGLNPHFLNNRFVPPYAYWTKAHQHTIRVLPGPELEEWPEEDSISFASKPYLITNQRDRMGIRLKGFTLSGNAQGAMISSGVLPGTIQLPPDGQPIILLNDAQTTGGYPRIAQVCWADLPKIAQGLSGQYVHFQWIDFVKAEMLMCRWRTFFDRLRFNINLCALFDYS